MEKKEFNIIKKIKFTLKNPKILKWLIKCKLRNLLFTKFGSFFLNEFSMPPLNIFLFPTIRCNLFCKMCDIGYSRNIRSTNTTGETASYRNIPLHNELTAEKYEPFIRELIKFNPKVSISGGEPLLYKELDKLLNLLISKYKLTTSVITNGLLLEKNAEMLVNAGLHELLISIDGLEETADKIRGVKGLFKNVISGLEKIIKLKKINKSQLKIILNFTITPINVSEIGKFVDMFSEYDIESITFFHMLFKTEDMISRYTCLYPNLKNEYFLEPSSVSEIKPSDMNIDILKHEIGYVGNKYAEYKIYFTPNISGENLKKYYRNPEKFIYEKKCLMPWNTAYIVANGDVQTHLVCFHKTMGNVIKEPFLKIWNNDDYRKFRGILKNESSLPICSRCCNIF